MNKEMIIESIDYRKKKLEKVVKALFNTSLENLTELVEYETTYCQGIGNGALQSISNRIRASLKGIRVHHKVKRINARRK